MSCVAIALFALAAVLGWTILLKRLSRNTILPCPGHQGSAGAQRPLAGLDGDREFPRREFDFKRPYRN